MSIDEERAELHRWQAEMERQIGEHDNRLEALQTVPAMLDELKQHSRERDGQITKILETLARIEPVVQDVRDNQTARKVFAGVIRNIAALVVAIGVLGGAVNYILNPAGMHLGPSLPNPPAK